MKKVYLIIVSLFLNSLFLKDTFGQSWLPVNTQIPQARYTGLHAGKTTSCLLVSTLGGGIYRSTDKAKTWTQTRSGDMLFCLYSNDGSMFFAGAKGAVLTSSDTGKTWMRHPFPHVTAVSNFVLHPSGRLFAGTGSKYDFYALEDGYGMWYSDDSAKTWKACNNGIYKSNALVESLAIGPDGVLLAGIYDMSDFSGNPKLGVMSLASADANWQRLDISVHGPDNDFYEDNNLHIDHVNLININNGKVYISIEGIYTNYAVSFSASKAYNQVHAINSTWDLEWLIDSIPSNGGFYKQLTNIYTDSKHSTWVSLSPGQGANRNLIYEKGTAPSSAWEGRNSGIKESMGAYLFAEDGEHHLYTVDYFSGDSVFTRNVSGPLDGSVDERIFIEARISPNPVEDKLKVSWQQDGHFPCKLILLNAVGEIIYSKQVLLNNDNEISIPAGVRSGVYFLVLEQEKNRQTVKFVKE
jgi:hypothetical protein